MFLGHLVGCCVLVHGEGSALGRLYRQQEVGIMKSSSRVAVLVGFFGWMVL